MKILSEGDILINDDMFSSPFLNISGGRKSRYNYNPTEIEELTY